MSLMRSVTRILKTPQGRKLAKQAMDAAKDPKTKAKIQGAMNKDKGGSTPPPAAKPAPAPDPAAETPQPQPDAAPAPDPAAETATPPAPEPPKA